MAKSPIRGRIPGPKPPPAGDKGIPTLNAVVIDDSEAARDMLRFLLDGSAIRIVGEAANAQAGIELCTRFQPDILFLDIVMPGMSGTEALVLIRELVPHAKVVIFTSVSDRQTALRAKEFGAADYILKPFDRDYLKKRIEVLYKKILKERL